MREFARLYFEIDTSTATRAKLTALEQYFAHAPPADAAWAVYFLGGAKPRQVVPIKVLRMLGTPYPKAFEETALVDLAAQADAIAKTLQEAGVKDPQLNKREIVAMIAYLQRLGTDIKVKE